MKTRRLVLLLLALITATACGTQSATTVEPVKPATVPEVQESDNLTEETSPSAETAAPNCLGDEISPIGQSIADDYDFTDYDQVMTWFCNGAEFEDILVALETEAQTDVPAEEMLQMLADGLTWEEIWQLVGLTD